VLFLSLSVPLYGGCGDAAEPAGANAPSSGAKGDDSAEPGTKKDAGKSTGASKPITGLEPKGEADLDPEVEQLLTFETPQAGKSSVYVPNPSTNRVAVVNAGTFNIENLPVGTNPKYAATVPGQDVALVLNTGTRDAALLRTSDSGQTSVIKLDIGHDANAIAIAPDGKRAVVYLNTSGASVGAQSFQDLSIVDLTAGAEKASRISVGFRPRGVQFSSDGARAFVITEDGISILDFAEQARGPTIAPLVSVGDTLGNAQSIDVQVTPDGAFALARREGESTLRLINLADGTIEKLSLAQLPTSPVGDGGVVSAVGGGLDAGVADGGVATAPELTDLDISPDGTFAIAVLRDRGALVRIPLPQGFRDPSTLRVRLISDQLIGSVTLSKSGTRAIAYTTALPVEGVVMVDLTSDAAPRSIRLRKAVRAIALSDDGTRALVLHSVVGSAAANADEDTRIDASEGYSLVDTDSGFAKLQLTPVRVATSGLLLTPDGSRVFTLLNSPIVKTVEMADLKSFQVTSVELSTPPTSIGFVPGLSRVFVGQGGEGGISFLDAVSGAKIRSVSGFEIASRIRQ
jgi:DNA-binding beta-propeller fold protein YncE